MAYAEIEDVELTYEGDLPTSAHPRVQDMLDKASARLDLIMPGLAARVAASPAFALVAKDVTVTAVLRRFRAPDGITLASKTENTGPFSTTSTYRGGARIRDGWFTDDELDLLREAPRGLSHVGTIRLPMTNWVLP